ncbi:spore germination protein [Neobacillus drentensis]|uniref:spore germination protein n=1 Tax=Neobacillus drentensis TaxID=220684 RepID=UPI003001E94D
MDYLVQQIKTVLGKNDDLFLQRDYIANTPVVLLGFTTLVDLNKTRDFLHHYAKSAFSEDKLIDEFWSMLGKEEEADTKKAISSIYEGKLIITFENTNRYITVEPVTKTLDRSIDVPSNENVMQGPLVSFTENIETNIGIVRKQFPSSNLSVTSFLTGPNKTKKVSLLFMDGRADKELVEIIQNKIEEKIEMDISHIQSLTKMMGFSSWETVPKFHTTDLPFQVVQCLKKGRVILFVDDIPLALCLPILLEDMFIDENDRNFPLFLMIAIRTLRVLGILVTLIFPGLYVALVSVNPEVLQIDLALTVAHSREGVPYPALVEIILMLVILELILEATIRLPKSVGPTITMVGGIILGQAVVEAKLVSNLLIIVLAATTIANSTIIGFQQAVSIRLYKYILVVLAAAFGLIGLATGLVFTIAYLASVNTFGRPYIYVNLQRNEKQ